MFGNALGWRISLALFTVAMAIGFWLRAQMQITAPTALSLDPQNLAALSPPLPPEPIVIQDQPGEAGDKYSAAAAGYQDNPDLCDEYTQKPDGPPPQPMQWVLDATNSSAMNLFVKNPGDLIDYQSDHAELESLSKIGQELQSAALRLSMAHKPDDARKFLFASYSLGLNLFKERLDYDEYSHGMGLMDGALTALAEMEPPDSPRARLLQYQADAMVTFDRQNVLPIYDVLASADPVKIAANAGDIYRFALKAHERMFRVEAILKVGRYRFDAARSADQLAAPHLLRILATDPDPVIQAAAQAAANLTVEQYRMIH